MITVVSEIFVNEDNKEEYLKIAADLKPLLADFEGFISVERFASLQVCKTQIKSCLYRCGKMKKH